MEFINDLIVKKYNLKDHNIAIPKIKTQKRIKKIGLTNKKYLA